MKLGIDKIQKYGLESLVILFSIILSFYIEGQRDLAEKNSDKNKLITDLINTIDEDQKQLDYIKSEMNKTVKLINEIQADINSQNSNLSKIDIINKISEIKVSYSFFSQEGIFNQLISKVDKKSQVNEVIKIASSSLLINPSFSLDEDLSRKKICADLISKIGASSIKDMGKVMGELKKLHADEIDFAKAGSLIKELLNNK